MNPKIKFAIVPSASAFPTSTSSYQPSHHRSEYNQQKSKIDPLDSSIDNLLELLNSPERKPAAGKPISTNTTNQQSYQYSSSSTPISTSTQFKSPSTQFKSPSTSSTPSYSYKSSTQSQGLDTSFDDILSGLESPVQSSSKSYIQSFPSTQLNSSSSRPNSMSSDSRPSNVSLLSSATPSSTSESGKSRYFLSCCDNLNLI